MKKIFRNGTKDIKINLKLLIAASNELPRKEEGLEALWDRFILRLHVDGIKEENNFNKMMEGIENLYDDCISEDLKITEEEYEAWQKEIDKVKITPEIFELISLIRKKITIRNNNTENNELIYVSDRRWKKIANILRTSAFLNGRKTVDIMDCFLIIYCIWNNVDEIDEVKNIIYDTIATHGYNIGIDVTPIKNNVELLKKEIEEKIKQEVEVEEEIPKVYFDKYYKVDGLVEYNYNGHILASDFNNLSTN